MVLLLCTSRVDVVITSRVEAHRRTDIELS